MAPFFMLDDASHCSKLLKSNLMTVNSKSALRIYDTGTDIVCLYN